MTNNERLLVLARATRDALSLLTLATVDPPVRTVARARRAELEALIADIEGTVSLNVVEAIDQLTERIEAVERALHGDGR